MGHLKLFLWTALAFYLALASALAQTPPPETVAVPPTQPTTQVNPAAPPQARASVAEVVAVFKGSTADHSKFQSLQKPFASGPEVTAACLACHTEASHQVMQSVHWTWTYKHPVTGQVLGKAHEINSFCGNAVGNETRCMSCHAGYGWEDARQPISLSQDRVDCLACHDRSGQYIKQDNLAGNPPLEPVAKGAMTITGVAAWPVDLAKAAQSVGDPTRENCGRCHFYGGGGDNVKHGDLSSVLNNPPLSVDVHMSKDGANMTCAGCHVSDSHVLAGSRYDTDVVPDHHPEPGAKHDEAACQSCHGESPHKKSSVIGLKLNDHTDTVACQTCHIPSYARGGVATKTWWDWSAAGKLKDGKPYSEDEFVQSDGKKLHTYLSTKGDFKWAENVTPSYAWFNGTMTYTLPDDTLDPNKVVAINHVEGSANDPKARIFPFKVMRGKQAYDAKLNHLVFNHIYGPKTDTAFWTNFDWSKSIRAGMAYVGKAYSGEYGFVETTMNWPITHMVAPADQALRCTQCHAQGARLAGIGGVYMPATSYQPAEILGLVLLGLTLLGVFVHGVLRRVYRKGDARHG